MGGAGAVLGLGSSSSVGNHLVDPANNAHNARHKRRRGSLSPPQGESSLRESSTRSLGFYLLTWCRPNATPEIAIVLVFTLG